MKNRNIGIDIIKSLAAFLVILLHTQVNYFDENSFTLDYSLRSAVFYTVRYISMCCVPLFLMSTGFLQCRKSLSAEFYIKIKSVLIPYFAITAVGEVFLHATGRRSEGLRESIYALLGYSSNGYSWYIAMFIGLYIAIPFLNTLWNALDRRSKLYLLIILATLTIAPSVQSLPGTPKILPDFWCGAYPITYYYTGAYIREFKPGRNLALLPAAVFMPLCMQYAVSGNGRYVWYVMNGFNSVSAYTISLLIFVLLYAKKRPKLKIIGRLSAMSLYIYLVSFYTDRLIWEIFSHRPSLHAILVQSLLIYALSCAVSAVFYMILKRII